MNHSSAPFTLQQRNEIVRRYVNLGQSKEAIALDYHCGKELIRRVLIERGIPNRIKAKRTTRRTVKLVNSKPYRQNAQVPLPKSRLYPCCSSITLPNQPCFCRQPVRVQEHMPSFVPSDMGMMLPKPRFVA